MKKSSLILIMILLLGASGCLQEEKNTYQAPPPPKVTVAQPVVQDVTEYATFTGNTSASRSVELQARVSGYLQKVNFKAGDMVKEGDLLFEIDPRPYQAKLDQAKADLEVQQADLKLAEATLKRKQDAYKDRAVSEVEVIEAKAQQAKAKASVQAAKAQIEEARVNLDYTRISAPIEGRISRNLVDAGNLVTASTLLGSIVDDDPAYIYFNISENALLAFMSRLPENKRTGENPEMGHPISMSLANEPDYPHQGNVDYADNEVDSSTGTIQIRGVFENPNRDIVPGLFARVRLPVRVVENGLLVPDVAVGSDQKGSYVLTVDAGNKVVYKPVTVGARQGNLRVVLTGIAADDRVIVNGLQRARPGAEVTPEQATAKASGPAGGEA